MQAVPATPHTARRLPPLVRNRWKAPHAATHSGRCGAGGLAMDAGAMSLSGSATPPPVRRKRARLLLAGVPLAVAMSGSAIRVWTADPPSAAPQRIAGHVPVPCDVDNCGALALISLGASH
jgi:hypothetical protein